MQGVDSRILILVTDTMKRRERPISTIMRRQKDSAALQMLSIDLRGHVETVDANLWRGLPDSSRTAFEKGSGSELKGKMRALHSSSALAVNFFGYWTTAEATALKELLELDSSVSAIRFEAQHHTGLPGNPPNLDVCGRSCHRTRRGHKR